MIKNLILILSLLTNFTFAMQHTISIENDLLIETKAVESTDVPTISVLNPQDQLSQRLDRIDIVLRGLIQANKNFKQTFICLGLFTGIGFLVLLNKIRYQ